MAQVSVACNNLQPLLQFSHAMDGDGSLAEGSSKSQAVSFSVGFEEPAKKPSRMPKHLAQAKRKTELSEASIAEKQMMAEKRRKKHIEDKLEKIHQMEEEAQRLAQAMIPLIEASQNSSIANGLSSRKLHRDNDIVRNVASEVLDNHESSSMNGSISSDRIDSSSSSSQH